MKGKLTLNLHGVLLYLFCDDQKLLHEIKKYLSYYYQKIDRPKKSALSCRLVTVYQNDYDLIRGIYKKEKAIQTQDGITIEIGRAGKYYIYEINRACLIFLDGTNDGCYCILLKPDVNTVLNPMLFMDLLLIEWLRNKGFFFIHASGVCNAGKAILFIGPSGSGKTTASLIGAFNGLEFLGDDLIILKKGKKGVFAYSYIVNVKVNRDIIDKLKFFNRPVFLEKKYDSIRFSLRKHFKVRIGEKAIVTKIYFINKNNERCELNPIESFPLVLNNSCFIGREKFQLRHFQLCDKLVNSAKSYLIGYQDINKNYHSLISLF
jgi:hypothetical protein